MRIIFDVGHPAHVHLYRNAMNELIDKGDEIKIIAREREITYYLLDRYGFEYTKFPQISKSITNPMGIMRGVNKLLKISKEFKPDLFVGSGSIFPAYVGALINKPNIVFGDTPTKKYTIYYITAYLISAPFIDSVCTPTALIWKPTRNVRYHGYHELAYLHPNRFKPDPAVLDIAGLSKNDRFIVVRFSAWDAVHDIGQNRIFESMEERLKFLKVLEKYGRVIITSETPLIKSFEKYKLPIPPEKLLSLLYYSSMYVGEGATLASEAGILGVPWIWIRGNESRDYLTEQEKKYGLGFNISTYNKALNKVEELFENYSNLRKEWQKRKRKLLNDKIDVTSFMVWFFKNYPKSHVIMRKNPNYDKRFKN